jgi:hypothetical protein
MSRPKADVDALIKGIGEESFSEGRKDLLNKTLTSSALGYDAKAVTGILSAFTFSSEKTTAIHMLQPYVASRASALRRSHAILKSFPHQTTLVLAFPTAVCTVRPRLLFVH